MKFIKEKIVSSIKDQLDFLFQNENNVDDFSLIGPEIGIDDIEGYMISGYIEIEGANARLFYYIDIDENNMVCISFLPPALPLTQNLLDQIEEFNKTTNYKAEYFERYLNIYLPYYSLFTDNVEVTTVKMIIETINDPVFLEMVRPHLKYYSCPKCGGIVELDYPYDADDYVYHCSSCNSDYSITEITGITDYIDEYK